MLATNTLNVRNNNNNNTEEQEAGAIPVRRTAHDHAPESDHIHSHQIQTDRTRRSLWREHDFLSGHVQTTLQYLKEIILATRSKRDKFVGYIGGVCLSKFIDPGSAGTFEGFQLKGTGTIAIKLPNHISTSHDGWLDTKIESLVQKGSLAQ